MDRIAETFSKARREQRAAFVAYLCAGDPDLETSLVACRALLTNGVDLLELGTPFSDPLADGLTNQLAAQRALASGMNMERCLELVRRIRSFSQAPIIFYTYYNLVFSRGLERFAEEAAAAGLDGVLALDLPPEESEAWAQACSRHGLKTVFIVAPTTPESRIVRIAAAATGFIYYVSREGVTGVRDSLAANIPDAVATIRRHTGLPIAVGFGISSREQVRQVAASADGVVVGSALVNCLALHAPDPAAISEKLGGLAAELSSGTHRG